MANEDRLLLLIMKECRRTLHPKVHSPAYNAIIKILPKVKNTKNKEDPHFKIILNLINRRKAKYQGVDIDGKTLTQKELDELDAILKKMSGQKPQHEFSIYVEIKYILDDTELSHQKRLTLILEILKGKKVTHKNTVIDGSRLTQEDLIHLRRTFDELYSKLTGIPRENLITDDELRNINSFEYLRQLASKIPNSLLFNTKYANSLAAIQKLSDKRIKYDPEVTYGDYYTDLILALQEKLAHLQKRKEQIKKLPDDNVSKSDFLNDINNQIEEFDPLVDLIYSNQNLAIERSFDVVKDTIHTVRQTEDSSVKKAVVSKFNQNAVGTSKQLNKTKPTNAESNTERMISNYGPGFNPMSTTSQPSEINLSYKKFSDPTQLRFGTQAKIDLYTAENNVIFERWLEVQQRKHRGCDIIRMHTAPTTETLQNIPIFANAGLVCVTSRTSKNKKSPNEWYYINKQANVCEKIELTNEQKTKLDSITNRPSLNYDKPSQLHPEQFNEIKKITTIHQKTQDTTLQKNNKTCITHIYFNNLSRVGGDNKIIDWERKGREKSMSLKLEELNDTHDNVAVITLPADGGLMNHHLANDRKKKSGNTTDRVKIKILGLALGAEPDNPCDDIYRNDFFISHDVKKLLYGDGNPYNKKIEAEQLNTLIKNSCEALGFKPNDILSPADEQAVYFHFVKFEFTNFIINKLGPESFNFTCKDAIDRGGVASAYYNLMKSIEQGKPMSLNEFETLIHGAPVLVKGRGMNKHTHLLWNSIDAYVSANKSDPDKVPAWLTKWRDENALPCSLHHSIKKLSDYVSTRYNEDNYHGPKFFDAYRDNHSSHMSKNNKINLAHQLIDALSTHLEKHDSRISTPEIRLTVDTEQDVVALKNKRLGNILQEIEKNYKITITVKQSPSLRTSSVTY